MHGPGETKKRAAPVDADAAPFNPSTLVNDPATQVSGHQIVDTWKILQRRLGGKDFI